jgi:hypothetical protein
LGLIKDPVEHSYWIYCKDRLFEILVSDEDRLIWKIFLGKQQFDTAISYCKTWEQKDEVLLTQAKHYFDTKKYLLSATYYAQTSASVEKVCLQFYDLKEYEALKIFLSNKILSNPESSRSIQLTLLCTWLLLVYLQWLTRLHDQPVGREDEKSVQKELFDFFKTTQFLKNAHRPTVFRLINTYERIDEFVSFAIISGEIERVVDYYIVKGDYNDALRILDKHVGLLCAGFQTHKHGF